MRHLNEESAPVPAEHGLERELRAEIRQGKKSKSAQGPAYCAASAPSIAGAAEEQNPEQHPSDQRQDRLVDEVLREQIGDEHETGHQSESEQHEAGADQSKHNLLER